MGTKVDIHRGTTNVELPQEVSAEIWGETLADSAFMQLARRVELPGAGMKIQTITGEPGADWVEETAQKPVSVHKFDKKVMTPYKLAVIEPFSNEFARDAEKLYAELVRRLPYALARKFDETIIAGTAPGSGFDVLTGATAVSLIPDEGKTLYDQFLAVDRNISTAGGIMGGIAVSPQGRSTILGAVDGDGRPLFTAGVQSGTVDPILGADVRVSKAVYVPGVQDSTPEVLGVAGDFSKALYGTVEGVQVSISDQATLESYGQKNINLWQQNMFAVRAEIEVGFIVEDGKYFNRLTGATPTSD